jgi:hypothetical protein
VGWKIEPNGLVAWVHDGALVILVAVGFHALDDGEPDHWGILLITLTFLFAEEVGATYVGLSE